MSDDHQLGLTAREMCLGAIRALARNQGDNGPPEQIEIRNSPDPGVHVRQEIDGTTHLYCPDPAANSRLVRRVCLMFGFRAPR